jgi:hypothetical protein
MARFLEQTGHDFGFGAVGSAAVGDNAELHTGRLVATFKKNAVL